LVRGLGLVGTCLFLALPGLAAGRRRAVIQPGTGTTASGDCVTVSHVRAGLRATYSVNGPALLGDTASYTLTYVSDGDNLLHQKERLSSFHSASPTAWLTQDIDETVDIEAVGPFRAIARDHSVYTDTYADGTVFLGTADTSYVPSIIAWPKQSWCAGATWDILPVTATLTQTGFLIPSGHSDIYTFTTQPLQRTVLSVSDSITVAAGTFTCVKVHSSSLFGAPIGAVSEVSSDVIWISRIDGVVVLDLSFDVNGNVVETIELQSLQ
jgi:hypothetical protein